MGNGEKGGGAGWDLGRETRVRFKRLEKVMWGVGCEGWYSEVISYFVERMAVFGIWGKCGLVIRGMNCVVRVGGWSRG